MVGVQAGGCQPLDGAPEGRRRQREIERAPRREVVLGLEGREALAQRLVRRLGPVAEALVVDALLAKRGGDVRRHVSGRQRLGDELTVGLLGVLGAGRHADNAGLGGDRTGRGEVSEGWEELAARKVAGSPEDDKRTGRRRGGSLHDGSGKRGDCARRRARLAT